MLKNFKYKKGHTLLEIMISALIFSLILLTVTELLSIGLKSWQIGETSIDSQNSLQVVLNRLTEELKFSSRGSCVFAYDPNTGSDYIAFDSPVDSSGNIKVDTFTRTLLWQKSIIYYTHKNSGDKFKILYREEKSHLFPCNMAKVPLVGPGPTDDFDLAPSGDSKILAKSVKFFEVTEMDDLLKIHLICSRNVGDKKLPYRQDFNPNEIEASIDVFTCVYPRNN